jgi:hypothetical protein
MLHESIVCTPSSLMLSIEMEIDLSVENRYIGGWQSVE